VSGSDVRELGEHLRDDGRSNGVAGEPGGGERLARRPVRGPARHDERGQDELAKDGVAEQGHGARQRRDRLGRRVERGVRHPQHPGGEGRGALDEPRELPGVRVARPELLLEAEQARRRADCMGVLDDLSGAFEGGARHDVHP
jgi:hypothetical protein